MIDAQHDLDEQDDLTLVYMYGFKNGTDSLKDEIERLRAALQEVVEYHIPSIPDAFGSDELAWAHRQHGRLRNIARAALAEEKTDD